ncbi:MAG: hypothetical protein IKP64_06385, partial [Selenomonadaceae bacterium]|nr:hypothetical protein [Selenomonadaceae bacterium]
TEISSTNEQSDKTEITAEEAQKKIDELIRNQKRGTDYYGVRKSNAKDLAQMALDGVIAPDVAVDAANKIITGNDDEYKQANEIYFNALQKWKEKRIAEFNPTKEIERLKDIAEKFPILKKQVERLIEEINNAVRAKIETNNDKKIDILVNDDRGFSLIRMSDEQVEREATYNLIRKWEEPYAKQMEVSILSSPESYTGAKKVSYEASEMLSQAKNGYIPTKGIYKRIEKFLNEPHEDVLPDEQWLQKNAIDSRVEYLFFKNDGVISLKKVQDDFKKILGKELASEISSQVEAAYKRLADNPQAVTDAKNPTRKKQILSSNRKRETERALAKNFPVEDKSDSLYEKIRSAVYKKLDAENNPNIKKFLDESFKDVYLGRYKGLSAKKFREYTPQQTQTFENYLATHEVKGNRWLPSAKYIHEKMKTNTHPNLKAYIENLFVAVPFELKGSDALSQLEACIRHDYTDDQIDRMEKSLAKKNEPSKTISETAAEENEVTMENNKTESTGEELNDAEAAQKQSTAINPFDVEIPQNAVTQSEEFQNTLSKMQDAWNDYLQGKIDIRETDNAIDKVIREYTSPILNSRGFSSIHAETFRALYDIHEKIRTEAEKIERETKAAEKQSSSENKQAASKATEQKAIDPIEQRAREALKAAGLEGKTAPEKYHSRQPYEHGNQYLVEILTKEKPD